MCILMTSQCVLYIKLKEVHNFARNLIVFTQYVVHLLETLLLEFFFASLKFLSVVHACIFQPIIRPTAKH